VTTHFSPFSHTNDFPSQYNMMCTSKPVVMHTCFPFSHTSKPVFPAQERAFNLFSRMWAPRAHTALNMCGTAGENGIDVAWKGFRLLRSFGWCWFVLREKYCRLIAGGCLLWDKNTASWCLVSQANRTNARYFIRIQSAHIRIDS
jgi:hypothetical protein